jgi:hypothetical protein
MHGWLHVLTLGSVVSVLFSCCFPATSAPPQMANASNQGDKKVVQELLALCYKEAKNKLIPFLKSVREKKETLKYSVTQQSLDNMFNPLTWISIPKGGHRKIKNNVTNVVVEYAAHGNSGNMDPGVVDTIKELVQKHVNYLANDIFDQNCNLPDDPNYDAAYERWKKWNQPTHEKVLKPDPKKSNSSKKQ